jgi:hypothetical protein
MQAFFSLKSLIFITNTKNKRRAVNQELGRSLRNQKVTIKASSCHRIIEKLCVLYLLILISTGDMRISLVIFKYYLQTATDMK